jgi:cation transport regulator ChaC
MLVFGYGSLMWDGWEVRFGGRRIDHTVLRDHYRDFIKKSTENWGTGDAPGPTLGLERRAGSVCIGTAFEFDGRSGDAARSYLERREGAGFVLSELEVELPDGRTVPALTPVNKRDSHWYLGGLPLKERARMARVARGASGDCATYVHNIRGKLQVLGIADDSVENFVRALDRV